MAAGGEAAEDGEDGAMQADGDRDGAQLSDADDEGGGADGTALALEQEPEAEPEPEAPGDPDAPHAGGARPKLMLREFWRVVYRVYI